MSQPVLDKAKARLWNLINDATQGDFGRERHDDDRVNECVDMIVEAATNEAASRINLLAVVSRDDVKNIVNDVLAERDKKDRERQEANLRKAIEKLQDGPWIPTLAPDEVATRRAYEARERLVEQWERSVRPPSNGAPTLDEVFARRAERDKRSARPPSNGQPVAPPSAPQEAAAPPVKPERLFDVFQIITGYDAPKPRLVNRKSRAKLSAEFITNLATLGNGNQGELRQWITNFINAPDLKVGHSFMDERFLIVCVQ